MSFGCVHAGKVERTCVPRDKHVFSDFLSFLKLDMKSRGIRLDKEDNMTIDGAILTADSHGDKFQCNKEEGPSSFAGIVVIEVVYILV